MAPSLLCPDSEYGPRHGTRQLKGEGMLSDQRVMTEEMRLQVPPG
jgi:hypothetical protein